MHNCVVANLPTNNFTKLYYWHCYSYWLHVGTCPEMSHEDLNPIHSPGNSRAYRRKLDSLPSRMAVA